MYLSSPALVRRAFICGRVICMETERNVVWGSRLLAATRILSARCHWHHYRPSHRFARVARISNRDGRRSLIPRGIDYLQVQYPVLIIDAFQLPMSNQPRQSYIKFLSNSILRKCFNREQKLRGNEKEIMLVKSMLIKELNHSEAKSTNFAFNFLTLVAECMISL